MQKLTVTGGARIGWVNASWPLAKLSVSKDNLSITALMLGAYSFAPTEVVALEAYQPLPIIGRGIRVVHSRSDYPETIIFWCLSNPTTLLHDIEAAGFIARTSPTGQPQRRGRGFPVRWVAVVAIVAMWNVLFLFDGFVPWNPPKPPGPFVLLALGLLLTGTFALQVSPRVQALVMRPGRPVSEIAPVVTLLQVISAFLLIIFTLLHFFGPGR